MIPETTATNQRPRSEGPTPVSVVFGAYKRILSPVLHCLVPSNCKYLPTCSEYAYTAFARYGAVRGALMSLRRLLRCHPWSRGGLDPVPDCCSGETKQHAI